ncbi:MAG: Gfo/Idh/MocA family protein [Armatimonadota bacterium]
MSINIGVLGFAHGHVNGYLGTWREHPEYGVTAVAGWDHDANRLKQAVDQYGFAGIDSVKALLARPDIQAVVIASETAYHADLVEQAAAAGKAIVLQKPLALTLPEADRIVAAVQQYAVPFTMAWQMRTDPQNIQMKALLASGIFGKVYSVRRRHGLSMHLNPDFANTWHVKPELNRDIWADDAAHPIDFIHWLLGVPGSVTAEIVTMANQWMPMDNGVALYRYPAGPLVEVCCSFTCVAAENTTEIFAEKGAIIQSFGDVPGCVAPRQEGQSGLKWYLADEKAWTYSDIPSPVGHWERILGLSQPIAEFLNGTRGPIATAEEARTTLRMVLATYVSVREGRRVLLDDSAIASV